MAYREQVDTQIAASSVTSSMVLDGTLVNADINASAAIALSKLATDPLARANHTGSQLASTISDFDTQVQTSRLDEMATPTASVAMGAQLITGVLDPVSNQDAATKKYVDDGIAGVSSQDNNWALVSKTAAYTVVLGTDEVVNCDASGGAFTISLPATPSSGDRVLIKKVGGDANAVTVDTAGSELIDGAASVALSNSNEAGWFYSDGTNYFRA